jgi:serine/threonine protein kinase/nucleoside phosphorylase
MSLPGRLVERLEAALLDAFPDDDALDQLVRRVGMHARISSRAPLAVRVGKLVEVVDAQGRVHDLLEAALDLAPGNGVLGQARQAVLAQLDEIRSANRAPTPGSVSAASDPATTGALPRNPALLQRLGLEAVEVPLPKHTILFLAANPLITDRLALDTEARAIQVELERSGHDDRFEVVICWAAASLDLLRELRRLKPTVVHFSGHRMVAPAPHGLYFQGTDGRPQLVSAEALAQVFGAAGSSVKLVLLSGCYTDPQATALTAHVDCVVGMRSSIRDDAARGFAVGFYAALGAGQSAGAAYGQGCAAIALEGLPDGDKPRLRVRDGVDARLVVLAFLASSHPMERADRIIARRSAGDPAGGRALHDVAGRHGGRGGPSTASQVKLGNVAADVVVITVLQEEYDAAVACLGELRHLRGSASESNLHAWKIGTVWSPLYEAHFRVAVGQSTATTTEGALATTEALRLFAPRYIAFVGVAGGFPIDGQRHGDVAVSSVVWAYEYGKVDTDGFAPRHDFIYRCDDGVVRAVAAVRGADWWHNDENPAGPPRVRTGPVASGDKVIDDPNDRFFAAVHTAWPKLLAVEMEGAGVAAAVHAAHAKGQAAGFVLVRGISDMPHTKAPAERASTVERDRWKQTASRNAARLLTHLVAEAWPTPPRSEGVFPSSGLIADGPAVTFGSPQPASSARQEGESQALGRRLDDAYARKQQLEEAGEAIDTVVREIVELKRRLREGGQLRSGDRLGADGRYHVLDVLGRGGFATVWKAKDRFESGYVAIKVLHANLAGDPQRRERFFRGARAMMKLEHPAVVRVLAPSGEDAGFYYFVMEFVRGGNLHGAVLGRRVVGKDVLRPILEVGDALALAHGRGMVHRDIKPANILLDEGGNAKLTDFDLVGAHDTTGGTRTGALGTAIYAAPECLHKPQDATARADVFGLGMTAIFCLSGHDLTMDTLVDRAAALAQLDCSVSVRKVLERAVEWKPDRRFADAAEMVDALREASAQSKLEGDPQTERSQEVAEDIAITAAPLVFGLPEAAALIANWLEGLGYTVARHLDREPLLVLNVNDINENTEIAIAIEFDNHPPSRPHVRTGATVASSWIQQRLVDRAVVILMTADQIPVRDAALFARYIDLQDFRLQFPGVSLLQCAVDLHEFPDTRPQLTVVDEFGDIRLSSTAAASEVGLTHTGAQHALAKKPTAAAPIGVAQAWGPAGETERAPHATPLSEAAPREGAVIAGLQGERALRALAQDVAASVETADELPSNQLNALESSAVESTLPPRSETEAQSDGVWPLRLKKVGFLLVIFLAIALGVLVLRILLIDSTPSARKTVGANLENLPTAHQEHAFNGLDLDAAVTKVSNIQIASDPNLRYRPQCGLVAPLEGCPCGFRSSTPEMEWSEYERECQAANSFCAYDCCGPGLQINRSDPSRCVPISERPVFGWLGLYARISIKDQRFSWVAFGASNCFVTVVIDGVTAMSDAFAGSVGNLSFSYIVTNWKDRAIDARASCGNSYGSTQESFSMPAAPSRLRVEGENLCWTLFPYFFGKQLPYVDAACRLDICSEDSQVFPGIPFPCGESVLQKELNTSTGCIQIPSGIHRSKAFVTCVPSRVRDADQYSVEIP